MSEILEYMKSQDNTKAKIREELVELNMQSISTQAKKAQELIANQVLRQLK